jgi:hypothetical protein
MSLGHDWRRPSVAETVGPMVAIGASAGKAVAANARIEFDIEPLSPTKNGRISSASELSALIKIRIG